MMNLPRLWDQGSFQKRFARLLAERKRTKRFIAKKLNVAPSTVTTWGSRPENKPSLDVIVSLSAELGVTDCYLAFGSELQPMDMAELEMLESWRKLDSKHRAAFTAMIRGFAE